MEQMFLGGSFISDGIGGGGAYISLGKDDICRETGCGFCSYRSF